jgi:hypothetical protein
MQRGYKIRHYISGRSKNGDHEYKNYSITVPNDIAENLPSGMTFIPRMCDSDSDGVNGLLFEPINQARGIKLPTWAQESNGPHSVPDQEREEENETQEQAA